MDYRLLSALYDYMHIFFMQHYLTLSLLYKKNENAICNRYP